MASGVCHGVLSAAMLVLLSCTLRTSYALNPSSPAFIFFSNEVALPSRVDYRTLSFEEVVSMFVGKRTDSQTQDHSPGTYSLSVAFLSSKSPLSVYASLSSARGLTAVKAALASSNSVLAFPQVSGSSGLSVASRAQHLSDAFLREHQAAVHVFTLGACPLASGTSLPDISALKVHLQARQIGDGIMDLVLICSKECALDTSEDLDFADALKVIEDSKLPRITLFAPAKDDVIMPRKLIEGPLISQENSTLCDAACQTKATILETLFVAVVLLVTLVSGLYCLYGIDTPTKFETPRDS